MNFEIFAIVGLVCLVFLLIQIAKMRTQDSGSEKTTGKAIPAFIAEELSEEKQGCVMSEDYKPENKLVDSDSLR